MIDICEESSYQFIVHYLITHIVHQTLLQLLQVKEKLPWKLTKVPLEAQPKWYQVEHLSQETMSSNRFGKSHSALHPFLMERLTLVFSKFNVTFDLTGINLSSEMAKTVCLPCTLGDDYGWRWYQNERYFFHSSHWNKIQS